MTESNAVHGTREDEGEREVVAVEPGSRDLSHELVANVSASMVFAHFKHVLSTLSTVVLLESVIVFPEFTRIYDLL